MLPAHHPLRVHVSDLTAEHRLGSPRLSSYLVHDKGFGPGDLGCVADDSVELSP